MSSVEYEQWLYGGGSGRDDPLSSLESMVSEGTATEPEEDGDLPKDYEAIRSWIEYSKSKTWLMETSRVYDHASTLSALPREHQVAVTLPKGELEKWLVRPSVDSLAGQLDAKLSISSENAPWLMSCAAKDDGNAITRHFSAVLSTPNTQWLCSKRGTGELTKWLMGPKKPHLPPASSFDPLSSWRTFQESVNWAPSPFSLERISVFHGSDEDPKSDVAVGEEGNVLTFTSVGLASLPAPFSSQQHRDDSIEKWLLPSGSPSFSSLPLFRPDNPMGGGYSDLDQWLSNSEPHASSDQESEASLISLSSEYELVDEL